VVTALYAALSALLIVWLSVRVIKLRRLKRVRLGDGNDSELRTAIRAQANATEYIPLSMILLLLLELSGGHSVLLHAGGLAIVTGRVIHARGLLTSSLRKRVLGMWLTLLAIMGMAVACLAYTAHVYWT
jgi:uncharacterized protein